MKRFFLCFIALTILFTFSVQAVAEKTTYYCRPNDNIYVPLTVIENPNNVVTASFRVHYDANVFDISQIITSNDTITIPVLSNIPAGYPVTVPFHVRVDAAPGTYEISAEQITGYDAKENEAGGILLAPMKVTVTEGAVIVSEPEPIQAAGSGALPDNANADAYDINGSYYIDEGCTYTNLPITSGTLQVIRPNEDGTACTQIATSKDNCFTRTRIGSEWGGWMSAYDFMGNSNDQIRNIDYYLLLNKTLVTDNYETYNTYINRKFSDYDILVFQFYRNDWLVGSETVMRTTFSGLDGVTYTYSWNQTTDIEYDIKYSSDTTVEIKHITTDIGTKSVAIYGIKLGNW